MVAMFTSQVAGPLTQGRLSLLHAVCTPSFSLWQRPLTSKDYSHRREWIRNRQEQLAQLFAIELEFRAELSNHLHAVLRTRPEIAKRFTPREVVRRWLTITKLAKCMSDDMPVPDEKRIDELVGDKKSGQAAEAVDQYLVVYGYFAGKHRSARQREDDVRVSSGSLDSAVVKSDESGLLLCGIYVDLNPIVLGKRTSPESAPYTSACHRLMAESQAEHAPDRADGWMAELTLQPERKADVAGVHVAHRASCLGPGSAPHLAGGLCEAAQVDRPLLRSGERTTIPKDLETILDHMDVNPEKWVDTVEHYDTTFCHAVGPPAGLAQVAERMEPVI